MRATNWSERTDPTSAHRRAGGRRHFNRVRQLRATARLFRLLEILRQTGLERGHQAEAARRLDVHRSTICRDLQTLQLLHRGYSRDEIAEIRRDRRGR